jgi:Ca2+-binding RTX toxin-like protein
MTLPIFLGNPINLHVDHTQYWGGGMVAELGGGLLTYAVNENNDFAPTLISIQTTALDTISHGLGTSTPLRLQSAPHAQNVTLDRLGDGDLVLSWAELSPDHTSFQTYFKLFNAAGHAISGIEHGNPVQSGTVVRAEADVTALQAGGFVNTWTEYTQGSWEVFAGLYGADGTSIGAPIRLNADLSGTQADAHITDLSDGRLFAVWLDTQDSGTISLVGRLFGADGAALGDQVAIASDDANTVDFQGLYIGTLKDGNVVLTWNKVYLAGDQADSLLGRVFDDTGHQVGPDLTLATADGTGFNGFGVVGVPMVALQDGRWMVAWMQQGYDPATDHTSYQNFGRIYNADGTPSDDAFDLTPGLTDPYASQLVVLADGRVAVYCGERHDPGRPSAFVQFIDPRVTAVDLSGTDRGDQFQGTIFDDSLSGHMGRDSLAGADGHDLLRGGGQADVLTGGAGDDTLIGCRGNDLLSGGGGHDQFVFAAGSGTDRIADFDRHHDLLDLRHFHFANAAQALSHLTQGAEGAIFAFGADSVLLFGVDATALGAGSLVL